MTVGEVAEATQRLSNCVVEMSAEACLLVHRHVPEHEVFRCQYARYRGVSLLECFVFGEAAAKDILECWDTLDDPPAILAWDESRVTDSDEEVVIKQNWTEIRRFMWNYVGIVRTTKRLERAAHRIRLLREEVEDYYGHFRVTTDLIELRNLLECANLIVQSALSRKESRGLHFITDYPVTDPVARDTVLIP